MHVAWIVPLAVWAPFALWRLLFVLRAQRIPATVVEIAMSGEDGDVPAPIVEYRHPTGDVRRLQPVYHFTGYAGVRVGDTISVLVLGDRVRLATFAELWLLQLILVALVVFIAVGTAALL